MKRYSSEDSVKKYILSLIIVLLLTLVLDYINISNYLNVKIENFNFDLLSIVINSLIVIFLYLLTYKIIDKKNIVKSRNKSEVCRKLLLLTYYDCIDKINLFSKEEHLLMIVKKVDFNSTEDKLSKNLQVAPFDNKNIIIDFLKDGEIDVRCFEMYFEIEKLYKGFISTMITFFDHSEIYIPLKKALISKLKSEIKVLENKENPTSKS